MDRLKFPHLDNLSGVGVSMVILGAEFVTVTEKIDGFNARFGRGLDGEFWVGTRNMTIDPAKDPLQGFAAFALAQADYIPPGVTIFGEWAGKGIQRRLDYGDPGFWFFDGHRGDVREMPDGGSWFDPDDMSEFVTLTGWRTPRLFHAGPPPTIDQLDQWRQTPGIEGIVIRAYPMAVDRYGHPLIAKFKSHEFSEKASEKAQRPPADMTNVTTFVDEYVTHERLLHVLALVAEETGKDALDVHVTGDVLRAMYNDIVREGADDFAALSEDDQKMVGKVSAMSAKVLLIAEREATLAPA